VGNVYWGAGVGAVVAIIVLARALSHNKAHLFDYVGAAYFIGIVVLLAMIDPSNIGTWGLRPGGGPRIPVRDRVRLGAHQPTLH
jgi:hypothetical protein